MYMVWITIGLSISLLLAACTGSAESPITPAPDQPTFLFFYTDG